MAVKKDPRLSEPLQGDGPGAYLRKAREEAEMSVDKVATALLLNANTVEALEADAYERLPAPAFVRGYLRGYARVLGLPSRPVLDMYDRQGFEPPPLSTDATESTQAHTSDAAVRLVTYAVAVVLVVLVALWWHSQEDGGFGISGDLFDRSADSGEDASLQATGESGTAPADGSENGESDAMASDSTIGRPLDEDLSMTSPAADAESGEHFSGEGPPESAGVEGIGTVGESAAAAPLQPGASPETETATAEAPGEDAPAAGGEAVESAIAGEGAAVTGAVEEVAPGEIVEVVSAPAVPDAQSDSVAAAPLRPGTAPGDEGSVVTTPGEEAASDETAEAESAPSAAPVPETAADQDAADSGEPQPESVAAVDSAAGGAPALETGPDGGDGEETTGESASAPLPARPAPETAATTPGTGTEPAEAQSGLVLEFVHESWVEVYDRERTRLFFGLVPPGRTLSFDGPQPFDVLLGYGKDVRVAIDGQAFDHTPHLKHGVARFSIGADSDDDTDVAETAGTAPADAAETPATDSRPPVRGG